MENLQELTECCICTEIFTDPRILPCVHTFCLNCLQQTALKNEIKTGEKMPCPFCRREFVIPTEGMSGLQKNFFMDRLVEITKLSKPVEKVTLCEICIEDNETEACEIPTATNYCIQCRKNICNLCCRYHKKFPDHKEHELLPLGIPKKDTLSRKDTAQYCVKHKKEISKLFCSDCKEVICMMCLAESHQHHKCNDIEAKADSFRKQILIIIERVSRFSKSAELKSEKLLRETTDFLKNVEREETAVVTRGKILKEFVDSCTQSLLDELNSIKLSHLKVMETAKEENEFHKGIIDSFKEYCRELSRKGSSAEICRSALNINNRIVELRDMNEIHSQRQFTSVEVSFKAMQQRELLKTENIVGKIKVEKKFEVEERKATVTEANDVDVDQDDEVSIISSVQLALPSCFVNGVTKLLHSIYILSRSCNSIYIFEDHSPFSFQKEIKINEIRNPKDIKAIEESKCLFVTDSQNVFDTTNDNSCIWKITIDDYRVTKWVSNITQPYTLSASNDGHLLVLREGQASRYYVKIYKSDAKLIDRLLLPIDVQLPLHICHTSNGEFIISHRSGRDGRWVISRLTSDGQKIIKQFNPTDDRMSQKLNFPLHLSLDSDKDRLFVAEKCRVGVFDSNSLNLTKFLLTRERYRNYEPLRLHYDNRKNHLIVAQSSGKVNVYEIN